MREIKFRAWNRRAKKMHYPDEFVNEFDTFGLLSTGVPIKLQVRVEADWNESKSLELMQFTGLLDKNGKEIWKSDLIRDDAGYLWEVASGYDGFYLLTREKSIRPDRRISERLKFLEVIGNVYEHPSLLKDTQI